MKPLTRVSPASDALTIHMLDSTYFNFSQFPQILFIIHFFLNFKLFLFHLLIFSRQNDMFVTFVCIKFFLRISNSFIVTSFVFTILICSSKYHFIFLMNFSSSWDRILSIFVGTCFWCAFIIWVAVILFYYNEIL